MNDVLPWLALKSVQGVGDLLFKRLLERFDSPQHVFDAPPTELMSVRGISARMARSIRGHTISDAIKRDLELAVASGCRIILLADPAYPAILKEIPDPPPVLYVSGKIAEPAARVAVVGARRATQYGLAAARRLAEALARHDLVVVSGMAKGIDTAAHSGALMGGGQTLAVLGSGLARIYPAENRRLFQRIRENGAVISEFPMATPPEGYNFPRRNRIISGLSLGAVVVEAAPKSGSLITARLAADQGREVFAVPGSIQSNRSSGTHNLIKQGAKLVETVQDVLEELPLFLDADSSLPRPQSWKDRRSTPELTSDEAAVLNALGAYAVHIDDLGRRLPLAPSSLAGILLTLELKGLIQQLPGKFFVKGEGVS